jgi:hypothetical protein
MAQNQTASNTTITPFVAAVSAGDIETVKHLASIKRPSQVELYNAMLAAAAKYNENMVVWLVTGPLKVPADIRAPDNPRSETPLYHALNSLKFNSSVATFAGIQGIVSTLIELGANSDARVGDGDTPRDIRGRLSDAVNRRSGPARAAQKDDRDRDLLLGHMEASMPSAEEIRQRVKDLQLEIRADQQQLGLDKAHLAYLGNGPDQSGAVRPQHRVAAADHWSTPHPQ